MATYPTFGIVDPEAKAQRIRNTGAAISGGIKSAFSGLKGAVDILNDKDNRKKLINELIAKYPKLAPMQEDLMSKKPEDLARLTYNIMHFERADAAINEKYKGVDISRPDYVDLGLKTFEAGVDVKDAEKSVYGNLDETAKRRIAATQTASIAGQETREPAITSAIGAQEGQPLDENTQKTLSMLPTKADFMRAQNTGNAAGANLDLNVQKEYNNLLTELSKRESDRAVVQNEVDKLQGAYDAKIAFIDKNPGIKVNANKELSALEGAKKKLFNKQIDQNKTENQINRYAKHYGIKREAKSDEEIKRAIIADYVNDTNFILDYSAGTITDKKTKAVKKIDASAIAKYKAEHGLQ